MYGGTARATSKRWWQWGLGSLALHAGLVTCAHAPRVESESASIPPESTFWMEPARAPEPREPPKLPQPTPEPPARNPKPAPKPRRALAKLRVPETGPTTGGLRIAGASDSAGEALRASADAAISGPAVADSISAPPAPSLAELSPQLSLWLRPPELQKLAIVRATSALLQAVPGYRDMLRGSEVAPFSNLERLRVFLPGLSAERLVLAGVHQGGEAELMRSAERIAATRERAPGWRGSSELRAAAWIDGSGHDRGLAVHGAAFLIGGRSQLPALLGEHAPAQRVHSLSSTRRELIMSAVIQRVAH